ncbi:hypothetical protein [Ferrimicrobium sp.]|uniref:hypothetical protein n=1 Tax=Ferrimicrobium sp. TaxID=2926050 RepID=UPI00262DE502|nr:hypothetical protein [Ferrimicrobium sp.]
MSDPLPPPAELREQLHRRNDNRTGDLDSDKSACEFKDEGQELALRIQEALGDDLEALSDSACMVN